MKRLLAAVLLLAVPAAAAHRRRKVRSAMPAATGLTERQRLLHVLNRLTFGPRPGDIEKLQKQGVADYITEQTHPERIDDAACDKALEAFKTLKLSSWELYEAYPDKMRLFGSKKKPRDVVDELAAAKLTRLVLSERQLQEVMTDFWFNHFNVYALKGQDRWLTTAYERDVIRPRVFGKFRDLLGAVAHSPAMLFYLDNAQSTVDARYAPEGEQEDIQEMEARMEQGKGRRAKLGLNENYARELLELHTMGVDGGYGQKDVTELARILTGWSIQRPDKKNKAKDFEFVFRRRMHDGGVKRVLERTFEWSGEAEGVEALDLLAKHPSTARFIALKLCRRFVADDPPASLVEKVADRFTGTDGDLRQTLLAVFESPEFSSPRAFRAKIKSPMEFAVSAVRASGAKLEDPVKFARVLERMGQPPFLCEPPTGWPEKAAPWINSGALLARMNFALSIFAGAEAPAKADAWELVPTADRKDGPKIVEDYILQFLSGEVTERTHQALLKRLEDPEISGARLDDPKRGWRLGRIAALVLGSPDFQRR